MISKKRTFYSLLLLLAFVFAGIPIKPVKALGISPPEIFVNSLRNTSQKKTVSILRSPDDVGDIYMSVVLTEQDEKFIKLTDKSFVIPAGQMEYKYSFEVNPGNTPNGKYLAGITFVKGPAPVAQTSGSKSTIRMGVMAKVHVIIDGSEVVDFKLISVRAADTETDQPTGIFYTISNYGNVDFRPDKIIFSFIDALDQTVVFTEEIAGEDIPVVSAGTEFKESYIETNPKLPLGLHGVLAEFFVKGEHVGVLASQNKFSVFPPGTLKQAGEIVRIITNKQQYKPGEKIKVDVDFENTGDVPLSAVLYLNISKNGEFVDLVKGNEYAVPPKEKMNMMQVLDLKEKGDYDVEAYVEFGKKKSEVKKTSFHIGQSNLLAVFGVMIGILIVVGTGIFLFKRFKKPIQNKKKHGTQKNKKRKK